MKFDELDKSIEKKIFYAGISLSNSINYDSGIAILDKNRKIITLDKFYNTEDLDIFLSNYNSIKDTIFMVSIPSDSSMLDGKWRINSKNYQMLKEKFEINKNNWINRLSSRGLDIIKKYKDMGIKIFRYDIAQLRLAYDLNPTYQMRSSLDCKSVQTALRLKYDFKELPENMLPASNFEAILGAMFGYDIVSGADFSHVSDIDDVEVLYKTI